VQLRGGALGVRARAEDSGDRLHACSSFGRSECVRASGSPFPDLYGGHLLVSKRLFDNSF
jgi:hypothetical protein